MEKIDSMLPRIAENYLSIGLWVLGSVLVVAVITPLTILPMVPLWFLYTETVDFYRPTAIELQRIESVSRSPVYAFFSETVGGLATIRAFGREADFQGVQEKNLEVWQSAAMMSQVTAAPSRYSCSWQLVITVSLRLCRLLLYR
jgi:ABC-type multidrug transport system fused ATPase/permease subunit